MAQAVATKVLSPGSTFPELLRRSRFASFDPKIRQAYGTPPSHLHRGNWGLKRPIAQRKRNAFISLKNFEEHQHYIEWSNAESQVRLIDKIEELNVTPKLVPHVPWFVGLGPAAATPWSMMDSEFSTSESSLPAPPKSIPTLTPDLPGLGRRGRGENGMRSSTKISDDGYLHPNLNAMSPRAFNRYLKKLRSLRPEFKKFLKENGVTASIRESGIPPGNLHIRFLGQHFDKQFQDTRDKTLAHPNQPQPIRQQPHRLGGLTYASPTYLESFFTSGVQPGIVLEKPQQNYSEGAQSFLVSTAGLVGKLDDKRAGPDAKPAFNSGGIIYPPAALLARRSPGNTFIKVRVIDLHLERLPTAVTAFPSLNSSKEVNIRMNLTIHPSANDHSRTNTHPPGSMRYIAPEDSQQQHSLRTLSRGGFMGGHAKMYTNKLNKIHDQTGSPANVGTGAFMSKLSELHGSSKAPERPDFSGMSWNRSRKRNWQEDRWIEGPNSDNDEGST